MLSVTTWIVITLALTTLTLFIGKKYGPSFMIAIYAALIVMANIFAVKIVQFGPWTVPAGVIVYGISFLITDALNEFFGIQHAKQAILAGFASAVLLVIGVHIVIVWEPAVFWTEQEALVTILGSTWRIAAGSLAAFVVSQNWDIYLFQLVKRHTRNKQLWVRNIVSTTTSQILDTLIFCSIAFVGLMPVSAILGIMIGQLVVKLLIALLDTPFLYIMRRFYQNGAGTPQAAAS